MLLVQHDGPTCEIHVAAQLPHRRRDSTIRCSIAVLNIARVAFTILPREGTRRCAALIPGRTKAAGFVAISAVVAAQGCPPASRSQTTKRKRKRR